MNAAAFDLGLAQLRQDPQYPRVPAARRGVLVEAALEDGRELARGVIARWGKRPDAIAERCGIPVSRSGADAGYGSVVVHAEYSARPPKITLYLPAIHRLARHVRRSRLAHDAGPAALQDIFVAHELYHHFDCARGKDSLARRHRVDIFRFGPWRWTSGLASLAEIAAGAFAQAMLDLPFHPALLDHLLMQQIGNHGEHGGHGEKQGPEKKSLPCFPGHRI